MLPRLTAAEKHSLLLGVGWETSGWWYELRKWWHVGNTAPVPRHGLPSLNMQDAAGGFRTYWNDIVGTVTCWPSLLAMAATWDPQTVREYAVALGREFAGKGANGILGPSVEVHRVAANGRNFEYLSGEDPYLGAKLTTSYVKGVQSQGVFAVVKHFVFNHQETNRGEQDSVVDDKTAWELYYPPFEAAVKAGVSAAMCSYNRINGEYACSNKRQLKDVLKGKMGFKGFVQSDWWATHNTSIGEGLDQEMPGVGKTVHFAPSALARKPPADVDEAAVRVLAVMRRMDLVNSSRCVPPPCQDWLTSSVTGPRHAALARHLAAESVVLLQNKDNVLPLVGSSANVRTIAIVGAASVAEPYNPHGQGQGQGDWAQGDYYAGGGSGHVVPGHVVKPLDGLRRRAEAAGIQVISSPSNDIAAGIHAARQADVTIIVGATTSGESRDRSSLHLDDAVDLLVMDVSREAKKTVVLMQAPGAVIMPWRDWVQGIAVMFLGGQETGDAWADVLFGDHAPAGRLPIMMPLTEADTIPPKADMTIAYSEGLRTSYRNPAFRAAFPFGHGLTYTHFEYLPLSVVPCGMEADSSEEAAVLCVRAHVRNAGARAGRAVPQLYLELSEEAGQPAPVLRGFQRTEVLLPQAEAEVTFRLTRRDLSFYDASAGGWARAAGARARVGESSGDLRQALDLPMPGPVRRLSPSGLWLI